MKVKRFHFFFRKEIGKGIIARVIVFVRYASFCQSLHLKKRGYVKFNVSNGEKVYIKFHRRIKNG